jgi:hypothetical protein
MFFRIDTAPSDRAGYIREDENGHETLLGGRVVDESRIELPWPFTLYPDPDEPLELSDYYKGKNLMSVRLVDALRAAGVDNLQTFPAVVRNDDSGELIHDFLVVNVIGLVSAADTAASVTSPLADGRFFHQLVLDDGRVVGMRMFRLAESRIDLIVDEHVANSIREGGFRDIELEPLNKNVAS